MHELLRTALLLLPVGLVVGLVGSLIGVGGGFFVVPFLLFFGAAATGHPFAKEEATAASLGIVLLSALSATSANMKRRRIDYRVGWALAAGTLPGAWLGRGLRLTDAAFSISFAALLFGVAAYLAFVKLKQGKGRVSGSTRELVDREGERHRYEVSLPWGLAASLGVGVISSLFGVGGGLLLVPFLVIAYGMPTLVATSTAQFIFAFTALGGLVEAARRGQVTSPGLQVMLTLGLGVVIGAQVGVALAKRVRESLIRAMISLVLVAVGALLVVKSLTPG